MPQKTAFFQPYSARAAFIRKFLPNWNIGIELENGFVMHASVKKHLSYFRPKRRNQDIAAARALASHVPPGGTIYDIGANVGLYTLVFAEDRSRHVVSFEPSELALPYLRQNVLCNHLTNVSIEEILLSDKLGSVRFTLDQVTTSSSHVSEPGEPGIEVPCSDLDGYIAKRNLPAPDVIKMDVEHHEEPILTGMRKLLTERKPLVYLEGGVRLPDGAIAAAVTLTKMGFELWDVTRTRRLEPHTPEYAFLAAPPSPS